MDETETLVALSRMIRELEARVVAKHQSEQGEDEKNESPNHVHSGGVEHLLTTRG